MSQTKSIKIKFVIFFDPCINSKLHPIESVVQLKISIHASSPIPILMNPIPIWNSHSILLNPLIQSGWIRNLFWQSFQFSHSMHLIHMNPRQNFQSFIIRMIFRNINWNSTIIGDKFSNIFNPCINPNKSDTNLK